MEQWEIDFNWLKVKHFVRNTFSTSGMPDLEAILFLIGVQELGQMKTKFNKEEKLQLIQHAACKLLSGDGYFSQNGTDDKGWPVWENRREMDMTEKEKMERLKELIIAYFMPIIPEEEPENN